MVLEGVQSQAPQRALLLQTEDSCGDINQPCFLFLLVQDNVVCDMDEILWTDGIKPNCFLFTQNTHPYFTHLNIFM